MAAAPLLPSVALSQQIWDIWQTTWDRSRLFASVGPATPISFVSPGAAGDAVISVDDNARYQQMEGFGTTLSTSFGLSLSAMSCNSGNYWNVINTMFNPSSAGLNYIRVPIGASDFSVNVYSLNDVAGDTSMSRFNISRVPSYVWSVLRDIKSVNGQMKLHVLPWSPPGWMKSSGSMNGGSMLLQYTDAQALYLVKSVQGFQAQGFPIYAVSIQNEPQHSNPTYPTCQMTPNIEARIVVRLRSLLNSNGLGGFIDFVLLQHNWVNAGTYPVELTGQAGDSLAGAAFHCYEGSVSNQDAYRSRYPNKEIYFTECTGTYGSDWWSDIKVSQPPYSDHALLPLQCVSPGFSWVGSVERFSKTGLLWNIALDGSSNPKTPGTDSCGGPGCRPLVTVNGDGSYSLNQDFYAMAQLSKAVIPRNDGGPFGQRIGLSVGGSKGWALRAVASRTGRTSSTEWIKYTIAVLNSVRTTINFRGMQATYTFPVGVTALWWYAPG
ncbi:glycoside hydrolase superfamily [Coprinopsis sp. MPI-PUGE-AT-0042]|nr:glycoside hydrolase superfamily [Coprinopsis sp. MPI-PUGE-AT-0042]